MAAIDKRKQEYAITHAFKGESSTSIAKDLGVTRQVVWTFLSSDEAKQRLASMRAEMDGEVGRAAAAALADALGVITDLIKGRPDEDGIPTVDDAVQLRAAESLLDRFGFEKGRRVATEITGPGGRAVKLDFSGMSDDQLDRLIDGAPITLPDGTEVAQGDGEGDK